VPALGWVLEHRNGHKEHVRPLRELDGVALDLRWLPDKWCNLVVTRDVAGDTRVHRKHLEMAVFMRIFEELQSGHLYVPRSEQYDDCRAHFMEGWAFRAELPLYTELVGLPADGATSAETRQRALTMTADETDRNSPENDSVAWAPNGLVIRNVGKKQPPLQLAALDQALNGATHRHPDVQEWLAKHSRFNMHFTRTSASWLNMVERSFRDLMTQRPKSARDIVQRVIRAQSRLSSEQNKTPYEHTRPRGRSESATHQG
jgi:hypothetical protein